MSQADRFLETASRIGARLCRDAVWDGPRCNWLGAAMEFHDRRWQVIHRSFGPTLYDGTTGIALFLARLHQLTGEKPYRTAAEGAIRQALSQQEQIDPGMRSSFYSGWTGMAWCLAQLGALYPHSPWLEEASGLVERLLSYDPEHQGIDVVAGSAGAIPALLSLPTSLRTERLLEWVVQHGEHLLRTAHQGEAGWSWDVGIPARRDLTGLAHGAAGMAWSLLELYVETGNAAYRQAAEQAIRYERHWFDAQRENWPDFRSHELMGENSDAGAHFGSAWCYGAAGIGLSRLRAYQILDDPACRAEAEAALRTTTVMREFSRTGVDNYSLCHGIGGNAELLIRAGQVLGDVNAQALAEEAGQWGADWYEERGQDWPCGVSGGGETPTLMLGLAGIGYFYLRLADPARVPSVLLLEPGRDR